MRRHVFASLGFALLGACVHASSQRPAAIVFGSESSALDCAESVLRDKGFQVQGRDVGAANYFRNAPVRRNNSLLARQDDVVSGTIAYVQVVVALADSTPTYKLGASGFSSSLDGTEKSSVLDDIGVAALVSRCGANAPVRKS